MLSSSYSLAAMQVPTNYLETLGDESLNFPTPMNGTDGGLAGDTWQEFKDEDVKEASEDPSKDEEEEEEEEEEDEEDNACWASYGRGRPALRFPPPIPLLARTGNLSCRMPWVLDRTYKEDGSLVIREVPVKHHEYFRTRRADGRLTLQLMQMPVSRMRAVET